MTGPVVYRLTFLAHAAVVTASAMLALLILTPIWGAGLDRALTDTFFRIRGALPATEPIAIVGIDDRSFSNLQTRWPWPRDWHAELIEALSDARVIVFDVIFDTRSADPAEDQRFAGAIGAHRNVLLASARVVSEQASFQTETWLEPVAALRDAAGGVGSLELPVDADGAVRHALSAVGGRTTLGYLAANRYLADGQSTDPIVINYRGPAGTFTTHSYYDVLKRDRGAAMNPFRDKLVFVGTTAELSNNPNRPDHFRTPYARPGEPMAGVEIHANVAANLIAGDGLGQASALITRVVGFALALLLGLGCWRLQPWLGTSIMVIALPATLTLCYQLFAHLDYVLPPAPLLLPLASVLVAAVAMRYQQTRQSEIRNRALLAKSEQRIAEILANQPGVAADAAERPVKVFLSYSHKPADTSYMAEIMDFVKGLHDEGIEFWTDQELVMGDLWDQQITAQLAGTDIALVLISQSYLDSKYCAKEVEVFLDQKAVIVPVMLSPCDWQSHGWLSSRQFLPGGEQTLAEHYPDQGSRQRVLLQIRKDMSVQAQRLRSVSASSPPAQAGVTT